MNIAWVVAANSSTYGRRRLFFFFKGWGKTLPTSTAWNNTNTHSTWILIFRGTLDHPLFLFPPPSSPSPSTPFDTRPLECTVVRLSSSSRSHPCHVSFPLVVPTNPLAANPRSSFLFLYSLQYTVSALSWLILSQLAANPISIIRLAEIHKPANRPLAMPTKRKIRTVK